MGRTGMNGPKQLTLGPFRVDLATRQLLRENTQRELRPRAFRVLEILAQHCGRLVDYQHLARDGWDGSQVSTHTINVTVGEVKVALQECGSWITCRSGFGYQLDIPESEDLLRIGQHYHNQFTRTGFEKALACFQQAAKRNGTDFRPWEAIATVHLMLGTFLLGDPRIHYRRFLEAHKRGVDLGGATIESKSNLGFARFIFEGNPALAETELLALNQGAQPPGFYARLAMVHIAMGHTGAALTIMERVRATDILAPPLAIVETRVRLFRREFDAAVSWGQKAMELHPGSVIGRVHFAEALEYCGKQEKAVEQYRRVRDGAADAPWVRADVARFMAKTGRLEEARVALQELQEQRETEYVDAYYMALLRHALGMREEALAELERARAEKSYMLLLFPLDPNADAFRNDPNQRKS